MDLEILRKQKALNNTITTYEIENAINKLKNNKAPGPDADGYTAEFYKQMKEELIPELAIDFNNVIRGGKVPESCREAEIITIIKPGKNPREVNSYRPISLMNEDYKIFAKILPNRLKDLLSKVIGEDQYGFIKGRNISHPIRNLLKIIAQKSKKKIAFIKLDVYKAFDTVNHNFLFKRMENLGLG
uniref:Reverse transcriptase domain-containing protein n=1 Tax=Anolis carolinensis TaxID=28377 RepID=A0A803T459_ANOCA